MDYRLVDTDEGVAALLEDFKTRSVTSVGMDFEGEFNLHIYGEHLCIIQLFDGSSYFIIDAMAVSPDSLRAVLESPLEKIMFDCSGDSRLVRRSYSINLKNVYDIRIPAMALGFVNSLSALISEKLGIQGDELSGKKKKQMSNWLVRPLKEDQIQYALNDVRYLFELKRILSAELAEKADEQTIKRVSYELLHCAEPKGRDKEEWERAPGYKTMRRRTKVFARHLFIARDKIAKARNIPASFIIDKREMVRACEEESFKNVVFQKKLRESETGVLNAALKAAERECAAKNLY